MAHGDGVAPSGGQQGPTHSPSFASNFPNGGAVCVHDQYFHPVKPSAKTQAAIEQLLAEDRSVCSEIIAKWKIAGVKFTGVLLLGLATTGGMKVLPAAGHVTSAHHHSTGHGGHKNVRRTVTRRRNEDDLEAASTDGENVGCQTRVDLCPNRAADGFCRVRQGRCRWVDRDGEVGNLIAEIRQEIAAVRKGVGHAENAVVEISDDVARQVFAVIQQMENDGKWRKAPMLQVFRLYCIEGLTAKQVAAKCGCSIGLISSRLKMLRQKLGRDPAELRQFSSQFGSIEDSLSDSRARRIDRKRAMDGDEEDV